MRWPQLKSKGSREIDTFDAMRFRAACARKTKTSADFSRARERRDGRRQGGGRRYVDPLNVSGERRCSGEQKLSRRAEKRNFMI